jgi:hypothetical protein
MLRFSLKIGPLTISDACVKHCDSGRRSGFWEDVQGMAPEKAVNGRMASSPKSMFDR